MMGTSLYGIIPIGKRIKIVEVFGYSTKGIPGLEIIGLKNLSRTMKEKFVFIGKTKNISIPLKRYVLCVENGLDAEKMSEEELRNLELPLLLLYWTLAGVIQIGNLSDCYASGRVDPNGKVDCYTYSPEVLEWLASKGERSPLRLLLTKSISAPKHLYALPIEEVMEPLYRLDGQSSSELEMSWS